MTLTQGIPEQEDTVEDGNQALKQNTPICILPWATMHTSDLGHALIEYDGSSNRFFILVRFPLVS